MVYALIAAGFGLAGYLLARRHSLAMRAAERRGWDNGYAQAQKEAHLRAGAQPPRDTGMALLYGRLWPESGGPAPAGGSWVSAYHSSKPQAPRSQAPRSQVPGQFYEELLKNGRAVWRKNGK